MSGVQLVYCKSQVRFYITVLFAQKKHDWNSGQIE